jgi:Domain of unknown function (DUF4129)
MFPPLPNTIRVAPRISALRRNALLALGCWIALLAATSRSAQPATTEPPATRELDVPAYAAELNRCADALKHPEQIHQLRESLPRVWTVRVDDQRVEVSTAWLASDAKSLEDDPSKSALLLPQIESRLSAMRTSAAALERGSQPPNFDTARTQMDRILREREFGAAQGPSPWELLRARIARWIGENIFKLLSRLHLGAKPGNALAWGILGVAFLALCYWIWKAVSAPNRRRETPVDVANSSDDPRQWAPDALAAADCGDYREAVHCAYWAAVVHLETLSVLKRDRARTPRESLRLLDPHPTEQNLLREFTRRFELIWYGYRPASANDWSEARSHLEKMGCLTPSTPATASS